MALREPEDLQNATCALIDWLESQDILDARDALPVLGFCATAIIRGYPGGTPRTRRIEAARFLATLRTSFALMEDSSDGPISP